MNLRPYQITGRDFIVDNASKGVILADDMGLGKTSQTIAALNQLPGPHLIVCPAHVKNTWGRELLKWGETDYEIISGRTGPIPDRKFVIANYDILNARKAAIRAMKFGSITFDECHYLMSEGAVRSKAAREIAGTIPHRIGLSGTPLTSRPKDLWNPVQTISPGALGYNFYSFAMRYCDGKKVTFTKNGIDQTVWNFDGASRLEELKSRLAPLMLRRLKSEVTLQLPAKTRSIVWLDLPRGKVAPIESLNRRDISVYLQKTADAKLPTAIDMAIEIAREQKLIVGCYRKEVAEAFYTSARLEGIDASFIHGGVSMAERDKRIAAQHSLLAVTIDSCGVGIDLSYASHALCAELIYEPQKLLQWEDRLHRFPQLNPVFIQYVLANGSVDELVAQIIVDKLDTFEGAVGALEDRPKLVRSSEEIFDEMFDLVMKGAGVCADCQE